MSNYTNDSIRALSDKEAMRMNPSVNLGADDVKGVYHTLKEIVGNSMDEAKSGYGDEIVVVKHSDGSYSVEDKGRGVPLDFNLRENRYNYELVFMYLNSGAKYEKEKDGNFEFSIGTFGLGAASTAFTSEYFEVVSIRDGKKYDFKMKKGDFKSFEHEQYEGVDTGTFVKWKPDLEVFKTVNVPIEWIKEYVEEQAIVNKGIRMILKDEESGSIFEYFYENGIQDYIVEVSGESSLTTPQYYEVDAKGKDREDLDEYRARFQIAFVFNNDVNMMNSYHNSSHLVEGGSPKDGAKAAMAYSIHKYISDNKLYNKKEKRITWDDIEDSLIMITNTYSMQTSYKNQTKHAISNEFVKDFMNEWLREQLEIYFTENPKDAKVIAEQVLINKRSSEKAEDNRKLIRNQLQAKETIAGLQVDGLTECDMDDTHLEEREIIICEGISASQTITNARDDRTMGTIALRGRFISSLKSSVERVLNNGEARAIIKALGCGIEIPEKEIKKYKGMQTFNIDNLRYGKIIIATDEDDPGKAIALALITFFYKFMPEIIKQNRLYISRSPRYRISVVGDSSEFFAYDEKEKEAIVTNLSNKNKKFHINIIKGIGELNQDIYWDYVLNPETRYIENLIYDEKDQEKMEEYFEMFMGEDTTKRKEYIRENITNINFEEVLD